MALNTIFDNSITHGCKLVIVVLLCILLIGCAIFSGDPEFEDTPYIEKIGPGLIRYRNEGASFTRIARREDVHKKIREACNGTHHIRKEGIMSASGSITPLNNPSAYSDVDYIYIQYECFP